MTTLSRSIRFYLLLIALMTHARLCSAFAESSCILRDISPRLGPINASTIAMVSLTVLAPSSISPPTLSFIFVGSPLNGSLVSTASSDKDSGVIVQYLVQLPSWPLESQVLLQSPDCVGSLTFTFFNVSASDFVVSSSALRVTGGSSLKLGLTRESVWTTQADALYVRLVSPSDPSISVLLTLLQTSPTQHKVQLSPKTFVTTTDNRLAVFGAAADTVVFVSLNNQSFLQLSQNITIKSSEVLRVLFLYDNYVTDLGWNSAHNAAKLKVASYFGLSINVDYLESLNIYDSNARVVETIADTGVYSMIIICTDYGPYDFAATYPNTTFMIRSMGGSFDRSTAPKNIVFYNAMAYSARYLSGVVAAQMIPVGGKICFLNCYLYAECLVEINAMVTAVHKYNPTAACLLLTINSYDDLFLEKGASKSLFDMGCDIILQNTNHPEAMRQFTANSRFGIGAFSDSRAVLGENMLTSTAYNWEEIYFDAIQRKLDGVLTEESIVREYRDGAVSLAELSGKVTKKASDSYREEAVKITVEGEAEYLLCGPIYDDTNTLRIPGGRCANYTDMLSMDWKIRGITDLGAFSPTPPHHSDSRLSRDVVTGYTVMVLLVYVIGIFFIGFVLYNIKNPIIKFSEPPVVILSVLGSMVGVSAVFPLSSYAPISDELAYKLQGDLNRQQFPKYDAACQAVPWLLLGGFMLIFPVYLLKLYRQHTFLMLTIAMKREDVSYGSLLPYLGGILFVLVLPMLIWQTANPLQWNVTILSVNSFGSPIQSMGKCSSSQQVEFEVAIAVTTSLVLLCTRYMCMVSELDEDVNRDSHKIAYASTIFALVAMLGVPIYVLVVGSPAARFSVLSTMIFLGYGSAMLMICVPKVYTVLFPDDKEFIVPAALVIKKKPALRIGSFSILTRDRIIPANE